MTSIRLPLLVLLAAVAVLGAVAAILQYVRDPHISLGWPEVDADVSEWDETLDDE